MALEHCERVLVFWCEHSSEFNEVRNEYLLAISLQKRVVPVLVDTTPMPEELGRFQAVDLRQTVGRFHDAVIMALAFWDSSAKNCKMTMEGVEKIYRAQVILPQIEREFVTQARRLLETS